MRFIIFRVLKCGSATGTASTRPGGADGGFELLSVVESSPRVSRSDCACMGSAKAVNMHARRKKIENEDLENILIAKEIELYT